jgi:hypothetical protein
MALRAVAVYCLRLEEALRVVQEASNFAQQIPHLIRTALLAVTLTFSQAMPVVDGAVEFRYVLEIRLQAMVEISFFGEETLAKGMEEVLSFLVETAMELVDEEGMFIS